LNSENVVIGPYEKKGFFQKCLWELIKMKLLSQVGVRTNSFFLKKRKKC